jgi:hypothetical protein
MLTTESLVDSTSMAHYWGKAVDTIALAVRLSEVMKPRYVGKQVNTHVVRAIPSPQPDYDAMQRLVSGDQRHDRTARAA